jgi:hypothetical protein
MSAQRSTCDVRTVKGRPAPSTAGPPNPTTFFLRSEKEIERDTGARGRKMSSPSHSDEDSQQEQVTNTAMEDSNFGVESLADTIKSTFSSERSDSSLSRTNSNITEPSSEHSGDSPLLSG